MLIQGYFCLTFYRGTIISVNIPNCWSSRASQKPGEVVIQTYNYDNPVIKYASRLDLKAYYNIILNERNDLNYPPFSWMAKLELSGRNKNNLQIVAQKIRDNLKTPYTGLEILGPVDCYMNVYGTDSACRSY